MQRGKKGARPRVGGAPCARRRTMPRHVRAVERRPLSVLDHPPLAKQIFRTTPTAIMITDRDASILEVSPAFTRITGYERSEVIGRTPRILSSGRHSRGFYEGLWKKLLAASEWQGEIWNRRKNGEVYPEWLSIAAIHDASGRTTHYVAVFSDITEVKLADARIIHLAHHDALTGLPNRLLLADRLTQAVARARRSGQLVATLFLDVDGFKQVNDRFGHAKGDAVLQRVGLRLAACLRQNDTLARVGGDEFAIVIEGLNAAPEAAALARKLLVAGAEPIMLDGAPLVATVSVGLALFPNDGDDPQLLIQRADSAMYRAKALGKNCFAFYGEQC